MSQFSKSERKRLERFLKKGPVSYKDLQKEFDISYDAARQRISFIKENNKLLKSRWSKEQKRKQFWIQGTQQWTDTKKSYQLPTDKDGSFKFAILSCTHLGSNYDLIPELNQFYDILEKEGVTLACHAGDVFEGIKGSSRKRQLTEIKFYGYQNFLDYGHKNYPQRDTVKTAMISGNHDNFFWDEVGADIVEELANRREDIDYVGFEMADININGYRVRLHHVGGGQAYARSYKIQRYLNEMEEKPDIYILGHFHVNMYMKYCGTHAFQPGCFKSLDPYTARIGKYPDIGGWIVKVTPDRDGSIKRISPEWISFPANEYKSPFEIEGR